MSSFAASTIWPAGRSEAVARACSVERPLLADSVEKLLRVMLVYAIESAFTPSQG